MRFVRHAPAVGGYDVRFGASQALRAGLVAGAKATVSDNDEDSPLEPYDIEVRLHVGWVFQGSSSGRRGRTTQGACAPSCSR